MLIKPDCIPCILNMYIFSMRRLSLDEDLVQSLLLDILEIPALRGRSWSNTSPDVIESVMNLIVHVLGEPDPFKHDKSMQNEIMEKMYPTLKRQVDKAEDPIFLATKLAIAVNAVA